MRISEWAKQFGITVEDATGAPGELVYRVKDIFTTRNGSWEPSDTPGSVPQWARDAYLKPFGHPQYFDDAGADHHLFGAVMADSGALQPWGTIHYYTYTDNSNHADMRVKMHGWANVPLFGHSQIPGPWAWYPKNGHKADIVKGGGLLGGYHVSTFVVWQLVKNAVIVPPIDPPTEPPTLTIEQRVAALEADNKKLWAIIGQSATNAMHTTAPGAHFTIDDVTVRQGGQ